MTSLSNGSPHVPAQRREFRLFAFALWAALGVALVIVTRTLPWRSTVQLMGGVAVPWLGAAVAAYGLVLVIWAAEWRLLAPGALRRAYSRMFEVVATMASVLNSIPFFAGETTGVVLLVERAGMTRGAALSVLAMDQLLSGLAKLAVLAAAALFAPLPPWLRTGVLALVAGVTVLLLVLAAMAHRWENMRARLLSTPTPLRRLAARVASLGTHLDALREMRRAWRVVALALGKKVVELLGILAVQLAFGLDPSLRGAVLVLAAVSVSSLAPVTPANLGVYEAAVFAAYRYTGVGADVALGLSVLQHLCFLLPMLCTGYVMLTVRQLAPRRLAS